MLRPSLVGLALLGTLAGCVPPPAPGAVAVQGPVLASYPPLPPPRTEVIPPPPPRRVSVVWRPGHWQWDGVRYDWLPGEYVERVRGVSHFVPGHWEPRPGGYAWIRGHWA